MHQYSYQACDIEGNVVHGQLNAENEQEVVSVLQSRQLIPLKIEQQAEAGLPLFGFARQAISNRDMIDFTNGLCTLIEARVPLDRALGLLEGLTEKAAVKQLVSNLRQDVKEGKTLAAALQRYPDVFSHMYVNMVHAGEEGGILETLLPKLSNFLSTADEAKRTIISAMIYPMILLITGLGSVLLLMIYVIPQFAQLFVEMRATIPSSARLLLDFSSWLKMYWWTLLAVPVLAAAGWRQLGTTPELQLQRDKFLLKLPMFGSLMLQAESSRFCRTLGALLAAGIPLLKALHIVRGVIDNHVLSTSLAQVEEAVRGGTSLGRALANAGTFPVLLSQLVIVGEESGRTSTILENLAETFDSYVKQQTARIVALAEPLLILVLGIVVGAIVITMLSAVFSIVDLAK